MKRTANIVAAACVCFAILVSAAPSEAVQMRLPYAPEAPVMPIPRTHSAPKIDGVLDDACWTKAAQSSNFVSSSGSGFAKDQTVLYAAMDKDKLYIAFRCAEPQPDKIVANMKDRDSDVWLDDSVEILLDPGRDRKSYFRLVANANGVQYDAEMGDGKLGTAWNGNWEVKTSRGADYWACEIAIPFSELKLGAPKAGNMWGFNAVRNQKTTPISSNWAGVTGSSHQPKLFGDLLFTEQPIGLITKSVGPMFYGADPIKLDIYNQSPFSQTVWLRIDVASADDRKSRVSQRYMLGKGEVRTVDAFYEVKDGDYLVVELRNDDTGEVYQRERYALHLPSPRIDDIKGKIGELEASIKLVGKRSDPLSQQLTLTLKGLKQKLDEVQVAIDGSVKTKTVIEQDRWAKFNADLDSYSERIRSYGNITWAKNTWAPILPADVPDSTSNLDAISLSLCVDEYESASFLTTNLLSGDFDGRVSLSDLTETTDRAAQRKIRKDHIVVRDVIRRLQKDGSVIPDALPRANEANEMRVKSGTTTQTWLTLDSRDAFPGTYTGTITIKPFDRSFQTKTIRLDVTVLPIKLPEKMPIATYTWDYAGSEPYVRDLAEHRINTFLLSAPLPELDENANLIKSGDYNSAGLQMKRDFGQLMYSYGIIPSYDKYVSDKFHWQFMDEKWQKGFRVWIADWMSKLKDAGVGYGDFSAQLWDEPKGDAVDKVVQAGKLLREIDPNIRTVIDPYLSYEGPSTTLDDMKKMAPYVDIWIPVLRHLQKDKCPDADKELEFLKSTGKPVWIYTCDTNMPALSPIGYYRLKPWYVWSMGLSGCAFWAYNSWRGDSWDDFDTIPGTPYSDNGAIYEGEYGPITTRRWEAYREGLEDYLYLYLLNAAIEKGKKNRIDMNALLAAQDTLNRTVPGVLADAEKDPGVLDTARQEVAKQIVLLNNLMPFTSKPPTAEPHDADMVIKWETSEPCVGTIFYRKQGSPSWRVMTVLDPATDHSMTLTSLRTGVVYEYYIQSVNDVGELLVDDNKSLYYTITK